MRVRGLRLFKKREVSPSLTSALGWNKVLHYYPKVEGTKFPDGQETTIYDWSYVKRSFSQYKSDNIYRIKKINSEPSPIPLFLLCTCIVLYGLYSTGMLIYPELQYAFYSFYYKNDITTENRNIFMESFFPTEFVHYNHRNELPKLLQDIISSEDDPAYSYFSFEIMRSERREISDEVLGQVDTKIVFSDSLKISRDAFIKIMEFYDKENNSDTNHIYHRYIPGVGTLIRVGSVRCYNGSTETLICGDTVSTPKETIETIENNRYFSVSFT